MSARKRVIASYLRVAAEDLQGARLLSDANNRNAAYLCSQAAEKVIRAVLTSENKHAGIGHKLDMMVDMVPGENPVKPLLREIESLGDYATTFRYPTAAGRIMSTPGLEDFARSADKVEKALNEACSRFGVDLAAANTPVGNAEPIR